LRRKVYDQISIPTSVTLVSKKKNQRNSAQKPGTQLNRETQPYDSVEYGQYMDQLKGLPTS
jgi:hypothetical protein